MKLIGSKLSVPKRVGTGRPWLALAATTLALIALSSRAGASFPSPDVTAQSRHQAPAAASISSCVLDFAARRFPAGTAPQSVVTGTFNLDQDSHVDLVVANGSAVSLLLGNGSGGFAAPVSTVAGP